MSHEDKTVVNTIVGLLGVLVVIAIIFYFIADMVSSDMGNSEEANARMQAKVQENIRPVGEVNVGSLSADRGAATATTAESRSGEQVYNASCMACHASGVANAPKLGDKAAWEPRAAKGIDGLLTTAASGINAMPPRGTCADCSDDELKGAIEYMLSQTGL
ncbi:MAG: hypothetical protein BMS9Abin06_0592 [Gammaproteobacteria bacterium]|nr:MAG: hypothetical protein BMS9Abin06_0592 [Gammaproteobacteria bacterium]